GASRVTYWIDGQQVASHAAAINQTMRPVFSAYATGSGTLALDWVTLSPYASSGTFVSRILDAGSTAAWGSITWTQTLAAGTILSISVRSGNTSTPDGAWSGWTTLAGSGSSAGATSRYLQYRVTLSTSTP